MGDIQFNGTPEEWDALVKKNRQTTMKLYTEEQVVSMLDRARMHKQDDTEMFTNEYLLSQATPISLPSDEEIQKESYEEIQKEAYGFYGLESYMKVFVLGAKTMRDKLQKGKK